MHQPIEPCSPLAFVLDDEAKVGAFVCKMLTMSGLVARQFVDPDKFLMELKLSEPDLVVLDLALGQSDAVEIIRELEGLKFEGKILVTKAPHRAPEGDSTRRAPTSRRLALALLATLPRLPTFSLRAHVQPSNVAVSGLTE